MKGCQEIEAAVMTNNEQVQELPGSYELATSVDIKAEDVSTSEHAPKSSPLCEDVTRECWDSETRDAKGELRKKMGLWSLGLLSMVNAGTGFGWALQLSLLTPYIQTLGVEHEFSSFVWLCGPIAGLVVQPIVGMWSDQCTSKWGRRRPYIFTGVSLIILSVTVIGFGADLGSVLGDSHEDCLVFHGKRPRAAAVVLAGFWLLDFASNTVDPPLLALIADLATPPQRVTANAIYCFWGALGSVLGYSAGSYGRWHERFPSLLSHACCAPCANLKAAFLLAIILLAICSLVTLIVAQETPMVVVAAVKEQELAEATDDHAPLLMENDPITFHHDVDAGSCSLFVNLLRGARKLPKSMTYVLAVMALSWFSWFPFFLFDTDWMGREVYGGDPNGNATEVAAYQRGVEEGAFGLLLNSAVSGLSSLVIDALNRSLGSKNVWALANFILFLAMVGTGFVTRSGRVAAVLLFAVLGFPFAITLTVPYSMTAELTADSGGGQGLAMGILNLAIVIPQTIVTLGAGPLDALFGGGNQPAFALAGLFGLAASILAVWKLPTAPQRRVILD